MGAPRILASLRSAKLEALDEELAALEAGGIDGYHLDVMDGAFVPDRSFDVSTVEDLRPRTDRMIDVHLMVERPESVAVDYARAGADRVSFHVEAAADPQKLLDAIREAGAQPGVVCFPPTSLELLEPLLASVDVVNPLGVDPRAGLGFQESTYVRIAQLVRLRGERNGTYAVQADGGVWEKTRDGLVDAGADELVGGYPIFSSESYAEAIAALRGVESADA